MDKFYEDPWIQQAIGEDKNLKNGDVSSGSCSAPEICAKRVSDDINAIVYKIKLDKEKAVHEIAFFQKSNDGHYLFSHKFDLNELYQKFCSKEVGSSNIRQIGDVILHQEAKEVTNFTEQRKKLEAQLVILQRNLYATGGVGIAANQCAEIENPFKLIVSGVNYNNPEHVIKAVTRYPTALFPAMQVLVNPVILKLDNELSEFTEGCLSVAGPMRGVVKRPKSVTVSYQDIMGKPHQEAYTGTDARVMLHELDHILNGFVYMQRLIDELSKEECHRLLGLVESALNAEIKEKSVNVFESPAMVFVRNGDGVLTFDDEKTHETLSAMSKETLSGILVKLKGKS